MPSARTFTVEASSCARLGVGLLELASVVLVGSTLYKDVLSVC